MALNPSGQISLGGPSTGQSVALELGLSATATISLNDTNVRTLAQVSSGVIVMPTDFWGKSNVTGTQKAIFGFGTNMPPLNGYVTNLVSSGGIVATDTPGVGTFRAQYAGASYGGDKAIFGFGFNTPIAPNGTNITNLISNTGVVSSNVPGVGTGRYRLAAAGYGGDKAIFGFGFGRVTPAPAQNFAITNLVSNTGVVASDTPGVGTARNGLAAASYGGDKAIFAFGSNPTRPSNLVSNTGVVASDTPGVGTSRSALAAASYGGNKAIFGFGLTTVSPTVTTAITNLVSSTGVVASDTPGVGTVRSFLAAASYGGDKAIFGFGRNPTFIDLAVNMTNLVSNTGVVLTDTPGVGTIRYDLSAAGYSTSP